MQYLNIITGNKPNFYNLTVNFSIEPNAVMKYPFFIQISNIVNQASFGKERMFRSGPHAMVIFQVMTLKGIHCDLLYQNRKKYKMLTLGNYMYIG